MTKQISNKSHLVSMLYVSTGELLFKGYISEYRSGIRYKLMSKLTKSGDIFYVFYRNSRSGAKTILHADVVYSPTTFRRRVRDLKQRYNLKDTLLVKLSNNRWGEI